MVSLCNRRPWFWTVVFLSFSFSHEVEAFSLKGNNCNSEPTKLIGVSSRRQWLSSVVGGAATGLAVLLPHDDTSVARAASTIESGANTKAPIAVLGASGRTGALCVTACLNRGIPVKALTRGGSWTPPEGIPASLLETAENNNLLSVAACDVKDPIALANNLKGCQGVIYAASASKRGGSPQEIDNIGVVQAGNVCLEQHIPRYIVISSTATTRPKSLGYIFTNLSVNGIMDQKRLGEEGVESAYRTSKQSNAGGEPATTSYTIVRPGGLEEPKKNEVLGPSALEVTQGDVLAGIISRADLAEVSVELALSDALNLRNTALELYYTDSTVPVAGQFKSMMTSGVVPRIHGDSYSQIFDGVRPDIDYYVPP